MRFWRMVLFWMAQLVVIWGFFFTIFWLYAIDQAVQAVLAAHRDWVTLGLVAYFAFFAICYLGSKDAAETRDISREAGDDDA